MQAHCCFRRWVSDSATRLSIEIVNARSGSHGGSLRGDDPKRCRCRRGSDVESATCCDRMLSLVVTSAAWALGRGGCALVSSSTVTLAAPEASVSASWRPPLPGGVQDGNADRGFRPGLWSLPGLWSRVSASSLWFTHCSRIVEGAGKGEDDSRCHTTAAGQGKSRCPDGGKSLAAS